MPVEVLITERADQQLAQLKGRSVRKFSEFISDLGSRGCEALQYRLTGPAPLPHLCVKHLDNALRVVVGFTSAKRAWVLLIGPHDQDPGIDVYTELYLLAGVRPPSYQKRTKPPCCEPGGGVPPVLEELATDLVEMASRRRKTRRR